VRETGRTKKRRAKFALLFSGPEIPAGWWFQTCFIFIPIWGNGQI